MQESEVNYTTGACGHPVIAVGYEGSVARKRVENEPCEQCKLKESEMKTCIDQFQGDSYTLFHGDCCQVIKGIPDNSIDFCIHSPPFSTLYIYSDSEADMGNCASNDEFLRHYSYLIPELFRVTVPGRLCAVHCKDLPKYKGRDGEVGLIDFPGMIVQEFEDAGWTYHSHVTIWKCPVTERERTNNLGLLHKTVRSDSSRIRQGMADYLLVFRKNTMETTLSDKPIVRERGFQRFIGNPDYHPLTTDWHPSPYARTDKRGVTLASAMIGEEEEDDIDKSVILWRRYAEPVWWDICQTNVLNFKLARSEKDEKHICPLQIDLIERAIELWTNPGDVVLSPFAGIGSEIVGAIRTGRKGIGIELKPEYFEISKRHCKAAEAEASAPVLFDLEEAASATPVGEQTASPVVIDL